MSEQVENGEYFPDEEAVKDYIIQKIMELQCELAILQDIAEKFGIPDGRKT